MNNSPPPVPAPVPPHSSTPYAPPLAGGSSLKTSALAIWSFVLGILAICTFLPAIPGLVLGILGLVRIRPEKGLRGTGLAIAGVVLSSLSLVSLPLVAALALPSFVAARDAARQTQSMHQVRTLYVLTQQHEVEKGTRARDWNALFAGTGTSPEEAAKLLTSPLGPRKYLLLEKDGQPLPPGAPLIVDPNKARRGYVVASAGGEVKLVPADELGVPLDPP